MSQLVNALIEQSMSPEYILRLPEILRNHSNNTIAGVWEWNTKGMNKDALISGWNKRVQDFLNNSWTMSDVALLEKNNMTMFFLKPNLITFDNSTHWGSYNRNLLIRNEFNDLVKELLPVLKVTDVILVPDLSTVDFFNEDEAWTVNKYRMMDKAKELYCELF